MPRSPKTSKHARAKKSQTDPPLLLKLRSGVQGLDEVTEGGLPRGRATLVCGGAGCGKTLFAAEFILRGATQFGEPGVFVSFEESEQELAQNVSSLGFDLPGLVEKNLVAVDHVKVERSDIEETGEYDLEGLFVRLQYAIDKVGAKRVALDTIESLFSSMPNPGVIRSELRRLFRWLKDRDLTVIITGERGDGSLTRQGLEEYVSDCVIFLDHRVNDQVSTRRLRVVKYRGSMHGTNEYPFLIDQHGFSVLPITSLRLGHQASQERISTGIKRLDEMLGGQGVFKGSSVLVSGTAGTGKTSVAAHFAQAACRRGARCLFFAFEESPEQLVRNMRSIGVHLETYLQAGTLKVIATRPHSRGLELHLVTMHKELSSFRPEIVLIDPITNLVGVGSETQAMLTRLIDLLKVDGITAVFTSLTSGGSETEASHAGISSLIDTWILLEVIRSSGERNRMLTIIKSRGMAHSNQSSEYLLTAHGMKLVDTYLGPSGVLTGSARLSQQQADMVSADRLQAELERKKVLRESRRRAFEGRLTVMREEFRSEDAQLGRDIELSQADVQRITSGRTDMARSRGAFRSPRRGASAKGNGR